ncbi:hypothetical protein IJ765_01000 [Candidatus Saccharibacteria bacterium]|nr:hypothetical protein [Candidatus Saccharibacteria bacterium]
MAGTKKLPAQAKQRRKVIWRDMGFWRPILIALGIVLVVTLGIIFIPKLWNTPLPEGTAEDPYASYRALYTEVKEYNFAHGGDQKLARKINAALESNTNNIAGYHFYQMAAAEYYYGVQDYERAAKFATEAENYAPTDREYQAVLEFYLKVYKKLGDTEKVSYYQGLYDELMYEPENCEGEDEE